MSQETKDYARGYQAGLKRNGAMLAENRQLKERIAELERERKLDQKERLYISCLDTVLRNCSGWQVAGEKINNAQGYCTLAGIFARHSITEINSI